jgi:recombination protein RecA
MAKKKLDENPLADIAADLGAEILAETESVRNWIDTGNLALNYLCSGRFFGGGIPSGKIIEIFGESSTCKTLFATNILKGCQKAGGVSVFLDAENTLNKEFAEKASHLNTAQVLVLKADSLEKAFAKLNAAIRAIRGKMGVEKPIVIVYDSIASSPSEREFKETEMNDKELEKAKDKPGDRALTCSKELRKLTPILDQTNTSVIFINQIRNKIGISYGCFSGHSKVLLADGTYEKIGRIVNDRMPVEVMSMDHATGKMVPRKVIDWHHNGMLGDSETFLEIRFRRTHKNVPWGSMYVTPNHVLYVMQDGRPVETTAGEIRSGDHLAISSSRRLTDEHMQFVYGSIMGDGSVRKKGGGGGQLRFSHGPKQRAYLQYKIDAFGGLAGKVLEKSDGKSFCDLTPLEELRRFADYRKDYLIPQEIADNLDILGLAIWYLDDGTFAGHSDKWGNGKSVIYSVKWKNREIMLPALERLGLRATLREKGFVFDAENTEKLHQMICRVVPECMAYKLAPRFRHLFDYQPPLVTNEHVIASGEVVSVAPWSHPGRRSKYDLTVEGNHNYVVAGAVVHNSPETTAGGGKSLPFYATLRLRTKAEKKFTDKLDNVIGMGVSVKNVKNKVFKPFVQARNMGLYFDQGINPVGGLLELLIQTERVSGTAGNFKVLEPYAGGREIKFKSALERNDIPLEVLLDCPALVDAETRDQVQEYLDTYGSAANVEVANEQKVEEGSSDD